MPQFSAFSSGFAQDTILGKKMALTTEELLEKHQAIIDAWFAKGLEEQKVRADELFARKRCRALGQSLR